MFLATIATVFVLSKADLPVYCRFQDVKGMWVFSETARNNSHDVSCEEIVKNEEFIHFTNLILEYPNIAYDRYGNVGTWTMIYNQGFEVRYFEYSCLNTVFIKDI